MYQVYQQLQKEKITNANKMNFQILLLLILTVVIWVADHLVFEAKRKRRRDYYRN